MCARGRGGGNDHLTYTPSCFLMVVLPPAALSGAVEQVTVVWVKVIPPKEGELKRSPKLKR